MAEQQDNNGERALRIFVTDADRTSRKLTEMSDFMSNRISELTRQLAQSESPSAPIPVVLNLAPFMKAVKTGKPVVVDDSLYSLDFDSLPKEILDGLKKGIYHLGESRQVDGNLRPVIVDKNEVRVKDLTLKIHHPFAPTSDAPVRQIDGQLAANMQAVAIQVQLRLMDEKLDRILDMQAYQIRFDRDTQLVDPFFDARDKVVHAQNETDPAKRREYLDGAVDRIEHAINAVYGDINANRDSFLKKNDSWRLFCKYNVKVGQLDQCISYITEDLQMLSKYISVLLQIFDYMGKMQDKADAFERYRDFMLEFYTKKVGRKQLPLPLQIHNVFDVSSSDDKDIWLKLTREMKAALTGKTEIRDVFVISGEDDSDRKE